MRFKPLKKSKSAIGSSLDLTPIVDVVFNLLIFFALSLNFAATSGGINVKLPSASSAEPVKTEQVTINMTKDGKLFYNEKTTDIEGLKEKLKEVKDKDSIVIIRADDAVPHGRVVRIMDIAKSEGLSKLAIAVEQTTGTDAGEDKK